MDWRPISTAPRDGKTKIVAASWGVDGTSLIRAGVLANAFPVQGEKVQGDPSRPCMVWGLGIHYPTHWIPLPEPPQ